MLAFLFPLICRPIFLALSSESTQSLLTSLALWFLSWPRAPSGLGWVVAPGSQRSPCSVLASLRAVSSWQLHQGSDGSRWLAALGWLGCGLLTPSLPSPSVLSDSLSFLHCPLPKCPKGPLAGSLFLLNCSFPELVPGFPHPSLFLQCHLSQASEVPRASAWVSLVLLCSLLH